MKKKYNNRGNKGSALIYVILITALLSSLVVSFIVKTQRYIIFTGYRENYEKSYGIAKSGINIAMAVLPQYISDPAELNTLYLQVAPYSSGYPVLGGKLKMMITDNDSKLNINQLIYQNNTVNQVEYSELSRLFGIIGIPEDLLDNIENFMQKNSLNYESLESAKMKYVKLNIAPDTAVPVLSAEYKNPFLSLRDMMLVPGMKYKYYYILRHFLTVNSSGLININTASYEVIESLSPEIDEQTAKAAVIYRSGTPFLSPQDIVNAPGMTQAVFTEIISRIETTSDYYLIRSTGYYKNVKCKIRTLYYLGSGLPSKIYEKIS
ncbi:MAG: type II secretion system minor pseudopilin [bacterium]|jgi:type II secretory pathway component PulK